MCVCVFNVAKCQLRLSVLPMESACPNPLPRKSSLTPCPSFFHVGLPSTMKVADLALFCVSAGKRALGDEHPREAGTRRHCKRKRHPVFQSRCPAWFVALGCPVDNFSSVLQNAKKSRRAQKKPSERAFPVPGSSSNYCREGIEWGLPKIRFLPSPAQSGLFVI